MLHARVLGRLVEVQSGKFPSHCYRFHVCAAQVKSARKELHFNDVIKIGTAEFLKAKNDSDKDDAEDNGSRTSREGSFEFIKPLDKVAAVGENHKKVAPKVIDAEEEKPSLARMIMMRESLVGLPRASFSNLYKQSLTPAELDRMFEDDSTESFENLEMRLRTPGKRKTDGNKVAGKQLSSDDSYNGRNEVSQVSAGDIDVVPKDQQINHELAQEKEGGKCSPDAERGSDHRIVASDVGGKDPDSNVVGKNMCEYTEGQVSSQQANNSSGSSQDGAHETDKNKFCEAELIGDVLGSVGAPVTVASEPESSEEQKAETDLNTNSTPFDDQSNTPNVEQPLQDVKENLNEKSTIEIYEIEFSDEDDYEANNSIDISCIISAQRRRSASLSDLGIVE